MKIIWSPKVDSILKIGRSLQDIGIHNWALTKPQALTAIQQFTVMGIGILGGDVYEIIDGKIQSNYDNWYCDIVIDEPTNKFLMRSVKKTKKYIEEYIPDNKEILFTLIPRI